MRKMLLCLTAMLGLATWTPAQAWPAELLVRGTVFEDSNRNGTLDRDETGMDKVAVSDGTDVVVTDKRGRYRIQSEEGRILFISVPGSHHAAENKFYRVIENGEREAREIDFPLVPNRQAQNEEQFSFIFVSDTHASRWRGAEEGTAKAYKAVTNLNPAVVIHGGDIILDGLRVEDIEMVKQQYELYTNLLAPIIRVPFYHAIGNHDIFGWIGLPNPKTEPPLYGKKIYQKYFGPTYYSFNYDHCHFVVLDSVGRTVDDEGKPTYFGIVDNGQLGWLRKDLSYTDPGKPLILVTHIPTLNALSSAYGLKSEVVNVPGGGRALKHQVFDFPKLLGETLRPYKLKLVLAGHYHTFETVHWKTNEQDALFVVGGSISGEWWKGDRAVGASTWPEGFTLVRVDGEQFDISFVPYGWKGTDED